MNRTKKAFRFMFHRDHLMVSALTVAVISLLLGIVQRLEFLDPISKVIDSLSMADIYYRINHSGQLEESQDITLVDITDLKQYQRDSIACVIDQVIGMEPDVVGIDIIFERESENRQADLRLVSVLAESTADVPVVMAMKLTEPDMRTGTYGSAVHSFFADIVGKAEGCVNVVGEPEKSIDAYPVYLMQGGDTVYSLPAQMMTCLTRQKVTPDHGTLHTINFKGLSFPTVDYRDVGQSRHLISGHKVLIGAVYEEADKHLTPIGNMSGLEVLAQSLNSMNEGSHIWHGGVVWIVIVALIAGVLMNMFEYALTQTITRLLPRLYCKLSGKKREKPELLFFGFLTESEVYDKIVAFVFMVVFTGFTYWLYTRHHIYVNTWLALATIAFIEEGRLVYVAWLTYLRKKRGDKIGRNSLYADKLE